MSFFDYRLSFIIQLVSTVSTNVELCLEKSVYPTPKATLLLQKKPSILTF